MWLVSASCNNKRTDEDAGVGGYPAQSGNTGGASGGGGMAGKSASRVDASSSRGGILGGESGKASSDGESGKSSSGGIVARIRNRAGEVETTCETIEPNLYRCPPTLAQKPLRTQIPAASPSAEGVNSTQSTKRKLDTDV